MPFELKEVGDGWKVVDDKGREYSRNPLPRKRAVAQMRALYAKMKGGQFSSDDTGYTFKHRGKEHRMLYGEGFFSDVYDKVKRIAKRAVEAVRTAPPIRRDYPPAVRALLAKYGRFPIASLTVRREPITSLINSALDYITKGKWNEARAKYNYDRLFHLSLIVGLNIDGVQKPFLIEKNEVINITDKFSTSDKVEMLPLDPPTFVLTLNEMLDKAKAAMGENFFLYDAFKNNCQNFIYNLLSNSNLITPAATSFILQPVENLLKDVPFYTPYIARAATDFAGWMNRLIYGEGCETCPDAPKNARAKKMVKNRKVVLEGLPAMEGGCMRCGGMCGGKLNVAEEEELARLQQEQEADREFLPQVLNLQGRRALINAMKARQERIDELITKRDTPDTAVGGARTAQRGILDMSRESWAKVRDFYKKNLPPEAYNSYEGYQKWAEAEKKASYDRMTATRAKVVKGYTRPSYEENKAAVSKAYWEQQERQRKLEEDMKANPDAYDFVVCPYDADGTRVGRSKDQTTRAECKARQDKWVEKDSPFFSKVMKGLTKLGDVAVDVLPVVLPGVGSVVSEGYKTFAAPGSKYYQEGTIGEKAVRGLKKAVGMGASVAQMVGGSIQTQLKTLKIAPATYLKAIRAKASAAGYDPKSISLSTDGESKITVRAPDGRTSKAGKAGYGDFHIWSMLERKGDVPSGTAASKQSVFQKSHSKMRGKWKDDKYSPNSLALALLW